MKKTGFYIIKDKFFEDMPDPYLKGNKAGNRERGKGQAAGCPGSGLRSGQCCISAAGWGLCHPDHGVEKLNFAYGSLWGIISPQAFFI